jgi:GDP-L-fucose synthase
LANACHFLLDHYDEAPLINVGTGEDISIAELAECVAGVVGYHGEIRWNPSKPDGTPRKLLDVQRINDLGWRAAISLVEGVRATYDWFLDHQDDCRA